MPGEPSTREHVLLAILTVRTSERATFRTYEQAAARIMQRHGGALEHAYAFDETASTVRELHVVRFRDAAAFEAYRNDPELAALASQRARAVIATEIWPAEPIAYRS